MTRESAEGTRKLADLEDLEMHNIDKSYLKATRKKKNELGCDDGRMWQNTARGVEDFSSWHNSCNTME